MIEEFNKYVNNYDIKNYDIKVKFNHSYRVMNLALKYASELNFSKEDTELAKLIGLLHDIGRFEQLNRYHSYDDSTVDHADYSITQLFDNNLIEKFSNKKDDYEIIKFAIKNHNKYRIPNIDDKRAMMHAKLIRDIDKLDIIYLLGFLGELDKKAIDEPISLEIINSIKNHQTINYKYIQNVNDEIAVYFAFAFDINNNICLKELKKNLEYFYKKVEKDNIFKEVYTEVIKYIDERI